MRNLLDLKKNQTLNVERRRHQIQIISAVVLGSALVIAPVIAMGSVESSLAAVQDKLVGTLLPMAAMCGLVMAGMSFVMGHPSARQHLIYAIVGAIVGFGSESIISLIRGLIH